MNALAEAGAHCPDCNAWLQPEESCLHMPRAEQPEAVDVSMLSPEQIGTYSLAFVANRADYLVLDGWQLRSQWVRDDLALLTQLGYLQEDPEASLRESGEQYTAVCYRPSAAFVAALRQIRSHS